ncbi:MAG: BatA and WFA domain-containing protein [Bryobacterales bacterium]|nr:BatA and WFA domain-containing protein [Bryobacterales bacterium]
MFLFNLSAAEFLALFTALSSFVVMLYLLDRSRRRHVVATLRFWRQSDLPSRRKHRRKIQQPWSLILQLLAIFMLLLAIGQLRIGSPDRASRDHVLLLDASAWMGAGGPNGRPLIADARAAALRYIRALPSADRVMLVRADALATPVTGFEANRQTLAAAIQALEPGTAALNLGQGLDFASQALRLEARRPGEIVFAGAGRMAREALGELPPLPANLRVLPVAAGVENCGIRKLTLRRAPADPDLWEIYITARNYGRTPRTVPLYILFGGAPVGTRNLSLPPASDISSTFQFRTKAAGWLEARLDSDDRLPADNTATLELPAQESRRVVVYSNEPALLGPVLSANRRVETIFAKPSDYKPDPKAAIVILDRFRPPVPVAENSIWIEPPAASSPISVRTQARDVVLRWRSEQVLAAGLHTKDARIESTEVFSASPDDIVIGDVEVGPAILARPGKVKTAVFGFHPMRSSLRYELATPLLFANVLKWMAPEIFLRVELQAGSVGTVTVPLESDYDPSQVRVAGESGAALPFTIRGRVLRFFGGTPGIVRVHLGDREFVYSLSLPDIADSAWEPPKTVRAGFASIGGFESAARDIWQWLALTGAFLLIAEWFFFGRNTQDRPFVLKLFKRPAPDRRKAS